MVGLPMDDSSSNERDSGSRRAHFLPSATTQEDDSLIPPKTTTTTKKKNNDDDDAVASSATPNTTPTILATKAAEMELMRRIEALEQDLRSSQDALDRLRQIRRYSITTPPAKTTATTTESESNVAKTTQPEEEQEEQQPELAEEEDDQGSESSADDITYFLPPSKRGYLFRWMDRTIGWSGTKWALRFVTLENGRIAYYGSHMEASPRYVLSLRGCAVRDEGWKRNRRHASYSKDPKQPPPPLEQVGAYFFLFSIYLRSAADEGTTELEVVPLLRFSTDSLAEKKQWVQLISETCAYCESDAFLAEMERRQQEQTTMSLAMPEASKGTLPPLFFAPPKRRQSRKPSFTRFPRAAMYRTASQNLDADHVESRPKGYPPSKPMHRCAAPSYLSSEAPVQNYRGFFNLGVVVLIVSNFRLILGTIRKHGFVVAKNLSALPRISEHPWENSPFVSGFLLLIVFVLITFTLESLLSKKRINESLGMTLHYCNAHLSLLIPVVIVWKFVDQPMVGAILLISATCTWMKLLSYVHANEDYRRASKVVTATRGKEDLDPLNQKAALVLVENLDPAEEDLTYPQNITLQNLFYFWVAPTLTYQIAFPRVPYVRYWRVFGLILRMLPTLAFFTFLVAQVITPSLENLLREMDANNGKYTVGMLAAYWLRLAVANTYLWLLMFYFYFHLFMNLLAELLRFGDRVFYKDWWNCSEVSAYWRLWNMPVHYWLVRHLYFPCVRKGMSQAGATFVVFFFSAVAHELLVSVPFHMIRPWSFLGMMMQMPLVVLTKYLARNYPDGFFGNVIFWVSFCVVGQPMAILLYTIDYQYSKRHALGLEQPQECPNDHTWIGGSCVLS